VCIPDLRSSVRTLRRVRDTPNANVEYGSLNVDLSDLIKRNAAFTPDKAAIVFEGETLSYAAFEARIAQAARALKAECGIGRGDRVAILSLNRPDYLVLLYACARLGAMLVPLNWRLATAEQLFILADAAAKLLVLEQAFAGILPALEHSLPATGIVGFDFDPPRGIGFETLLARARGDGRDPDADLSCPLLIVYTSGTTGRPKGAVLRQQALLWNGVMSQHMHALTADDHVLTVLPFFHVGGLNIQTTPALHHGATVTIHARFAPETTLDTIARARPTLTVLVPAIIQAVTDHPDWAATDLSSLKAISTGSTIVPPHLIDRFVARGVPVLQVYGSTETCPVAVYTRLGGDLSRVGSTGLPGLCCEAKVIDDAGNELAPQTAGEIAVRGMNLFTEYWGNEEATRQALRDGWYRTGDIGWRDADGYFWVRDRKRNLIISGGENIYPAEIERVLLEHPDISECGVIGRPDPRWDEVPVAYVIRRAGGLVEADALKAHLLTQLARFKVPNEYVFVEDLPRTALGKVQHFLLRELDRPTPSKVNPS
jgi:fatty-acyl-CoA synthase